MPKSIFLELSVAFCMVFSDEINQSTISSGAALSLGFFACGIGCVAACTAPIVLNDLLSQGKIVASEVSGDASRFSRSSKDSGAYLS